MLDHHSVLMLAADATCQPCASSDVYLFTFTAIPTRRLVVTHVLCGRIGALPTQYKIVGGTRLGSHLSEQWQSE